MNQFPRQGFSLVGNGQARTLQAAPGYMLAAETAARSNMTGVYSLLASIALVGGIIWGAKKVLG